MIPPKSTTLDEFESNELFSPGVTVEEGSAIEEDNGPATIADELPEINKRDSINLFAPTPFRLFLHWSFAGDPAAALLEAFGAVASQYRLAVRLIDIENEAARVYEASPDLTQWFDALPDRDYRADVGFSADVLPFITLLSSAVARTPPVSVSLNADPASQFHITAPEFARVLEHTGYAPGAVEEMTQPEKLSAPVSKGYQSGVNAASSNH